MLGALEDLVVSGWLVRAWSEHVPYRKTDALTAVTHFSINLRLDIFFKLDTDNLVAYFAYGHRSVCLLDKSKSSYVLCLAVRTWEIGARWAGIASAMA